MKYHVITPLARFENLKPLISMLQPMEIEWHVITDDDNGFSFNFTQNWIHSYVCPNSEKAFWERCNNSINWFLDTQKIEEEDMYCILNDDDGYEPSFFEKLKNIQACTHIKKDKNVLICSMEREHQIPAGLVWPKDHPATKLWATPSYMRIGWVGIEQIIVKGKIIKNYRLPLEVCGDGYFICKILSKHLPIYVPTANVYFNYFEPGRWNKS